MMIWAALLSGVTVAVGLWLLADSLRRAPRDLVPVTLPDRVGVSVAARRAQPLTGPSRRQTVRGGSGLDRSRSLRRWSLYRSLDHDLRVVDDTFESVVSQQILLAAVGFASPLVLFLVLFPLVGLTLAPAVVLMVALASAAMGFLAPPAVLRSQARARRAEFAASVSHYVSFVEVMVSGGHSIDGAFEFAAELGEGWAWDELRFAIASASSATLAPYRALEQLGDELDVPELATLARRLGQTQSTGAAIGPALRALADSLAADRARRSRVEDDQVTEKMTFPLMVILIALLTFFGIAAVTAILRAAETL